VNNCNRPPKEIRMVEFRLELSLGHEPMRSWSLDLFDNLRSLDTFCCDDLFKFARPRVYIDSESALGIAAPM
jgi:hypothetical protein